MHINFYLIFFFPFLKLPISPKQRETLNNSVSSLSDEDNGNVSADLKNVYTRLEENLQNQLEKCKTWR